MIFHELAQAGIELTVAQNCLELGDDLPVSAS